MTQLNKSELMLYSYLARNGKRTQRTLVQEGFLPRPLRYQIKRLLDKGRIIKYPNMQDLRSPYYMVENRPTEEDVKSAYKVIRFFRDLAKQEGRLSVFNEYEVIHNILQLELEIYKYDTK